MMTEGINGNNNETGTERSFRIEESFPTDIDLVERIGNDFKERLVFRGWEPYEAESLEIAFHEALVNAIAHGNLGITKPKNSTEDIGIIAKREQTAHPTDKKVFITTEISKERVKVVIRDEGAGFTPKMVADPTAPEGLFKAEGRGMLFMKAYFDTVTHNDRGNEITLVKEIK